MGKVPHIKSAFQEKISTDLRSLIESRGIELRPSGPGRWRASCPFHAERTPSFYIFEKSNRYHCFGCGEGGDAIDFIRRLDGCTFRDAVMQLTGERPGRYRPDPAVAKKRKADAGFRKWLAAYSSFLGAIVCGCRTFLYRYCRNPDDLDRFIKIIDLQSRAQLHLDAIVQGDRERLAEVFRQFLAGEMNYV